VLIIKIDNLQKMLQFLNKKFNPEKSENSNSNDPLCSILSQFPPYLVTSDYTKAQISADKENDRPNLNLNFKLDQSYIIYSDACLLWIKTSGSKTLNLRGVSTASLLSLLSSKR
jgi:hypothetical protein